MEPRDWDSNAGADCAGGATEATGLSWVLSSEGTGRAPALEGLPCCSEWVGSKDHDALVELACSWPDSCSAAEGNENGADLGGMPFVEWVKGMLP